MRIEFDDGTLLLRDATENVPHAEWDDRVDEHRTQAYRYRALLEWAGTWTGSDDQATLRDGFGAACEDAARGYPDLDLTPALHIEPRDYQQAALDAWIDHDRRGSVVLPTGSGKTFLGLQAIANAGVSTLVVTPTIDLMNQWHATLTNAFGNQLTEPVGVLGGGNHDVTAITVTTYDSAYRYVNEYGDRFGLLVVDEEHHLPAPTYRQIPEMMIAPYRLGLTATYERPDGKHELLEDLLGPVVYREDVDELAGEYLSEYETIHMSVDLTADEREEYDEEYQIYRDYVDSHEFDLWKEEGYAEFLKRTSYDPQGRRALIAKQRAERIARTAKKKLDTLDNLSKRHHDDRAIIFTANNDFAYDISQEFIVPCITHQTKTDERTEILERFRSGEYSMLVTSQVLDEGIDVPAANVGIIL
ncbi:MAG: DEAD/DEAH box helicase family protein, partial [Bacteroides sp.]